MTSRAGYPMALQALWWAAANSIAGVAVGLGIVGVLWRQASEARDQAQTQALRAEAIHLRIAAAGTAREWIEAVMVAESTEHETAADRREIAELIPRMNAGIERHYRAAKEELARMERPRKGEVWGGGGGG